MGKSSAPPPPDYQQLATQQGAQNRETAIAEWQLNNANQTTPWGSKTTTKLSGTDPATGLPYGDTAYSVNTTLDPTDQANLNKQREIQSSLMNLAPSALNNVWSQIGKAPTPENLPPMSYAVDTGGGQQLDFSGLPGAQYGTQASPIQSSLDFSGAPALGNPDAIRNQVTNSAYNQFMSRFAPAAAQQQNALNTRIANMGGVSDSDAARRMTGGLLTSQGDQLRQAAFDAISRGGEEAQRQFGMGLQARQQATGEIGQQGQFYNAAQGQQFGQGMENVAAHNAALQMTANLLGQQNQQNNALNQQNIQNAFANANLANASRAQGLTEQSSLRQMRLNELMALLSGSQVQQPTFQPVTATNIQPAPIFQAGQAQWNAQQQLAANQANQSNSMMGGLASMAGTAAMVF